MSDDLEATRILAMSESELLDYVIENANYMTDSYYRCFAEAIYKRQEELIEKRGARQPGAQVPVPFAVESKAFEAHAKLAGLNMGQHPLHYLFLDPKTYAARQAWKAALEFAPPAQGIDLGQLRSLLVRINEDEDGDSYHNLSCDALALIDQRDARPGAEP